MINFEQLASEMVGDGKTPNVYFITDRESTVLAVVTTTLDHAVYVAGSIDAYLVEDRLTGIVWESLEFERLHSAENE